jgi:hypothetical protein
MAALIRVLAVVASALVLIGFTTFASEQAAIGSQSQVAKLGADLNDPSPAPSTERQRERAHGRVHEAIDDANDVLLAPFSNLVGSDDIWVRRLVPGILALLVYGLGLGLAANYLPKPAGRSRDWRSA